LFDVARKGRVRHQYVEAEAAIVLLVPARSELAELPPASAVGLLPFVLFDYLLPCRPIERVQVDDVGFAVPGDEVKTTGDANAFLVEIEGEDFLLDIIDATRGFYFHCEEVRRRQTHFNEYLQPNVVHRVDREPSRSASRIDDGFMLLRVQHLHAHVDDPTRREILPLLPLGGFRDEIFECVVDHVQVGVEKLPFLKRTDADLKMIRRKTNSLIIQENARPFLLCIVE